MLNQFNKGELKMNKPVIRVYFETPKGSYSEEVATFTEEEHYDACYPVLEKLAEDIGYILTESFLELENE
jgi:hypothetical protein